MSTNSFSVCDWDKIPDTEKAAILTNVNDTLRGYIKQLTAQVEFAEKNGIFLDNRPFHKLDRQERQERLDFIQQKNQE